MGSSEASGDTGGLCSLVGEVMALVSFVLGCRALSSGERSEFAGLVGVVGGELSCAGTSCRGSWAGRARGFGLVDRGEAGLSVDEGSVMGDAAAGCFTGGDQTEIQN
jgi:hypothetical protein